MTEKKIPLGIMQGRLSPRYMGRYQAFPVSNWHQEFVVARRLGFDYIELIFDYNNYDRNPLFTEEGIETIRMLSRQCGVRTPSVCADYFMKFPLHTMDSVAAAQSAAVLNQLIINSSSAGVTDITVPCVDESSLRDEGDKSRFVAAIERCLPIAEQYAVNINLETDLPPHSFAALLGRLVHDNVKVNYDIGNSASLGYDPRREIAEYGTRISVVHAKDRLLSGASVKLGTGNADFAAVFNGLRSIGFDGILTMQAARAEAASDEIGFVEEQFEFVKKTLERWFYNGT